MGFTSLRTWQVLTFLLLWITYCITYFLRKPLGIIKGDLSSELLLTKVSLGWCDLALTLPYALVQLLLPFLSDKFDARWILSSCLLGAGISAYFTSHATGPLTLCLALLLTGGFLGPCWPTLSKFLSSWFPDNRLNSVFGAINTATYSGGVGGTALGVALLEYYGWRSVFLPPAILSIGIAGIIINSMISYFPVYS